MFCYHWFDECGHECESDSFDTFEEAEAEADKVGGWVIDMSDAYCDSMIEACEYAADYDCDV